MTALGHPAGMPHQALGLSIAVNADQQAATQRRRLLTLLAVASTQVRIDPRSSRLHRQFTQRGEVGLAEKCIDGGARLFRHIHLAFTQALQQLARRQVDQQNFVGFLQHPVRQGFAHLHAGDIAHLIIQCFEVLHVDRGVHVDAGIQQLLHILPTFAVAAAGGIAVRQLIDQQQLRRFGQNAVEVHLAQRHATVFQTLLRLLRQAGEHGLGFRAAMGFHHTDAQVDALAQLRLRRLQHGVGLTYARCRTEKDL